VAAESQAPLFDGEALPAPPPVPPADPGDAVRALATVLHERHGERLHLGTSSWHFPGWRGLVWQGRHSESTLARHGLAACARHPLLRTVSLDRAFYRPLDVATCARLAAQVGPDFRFVVKAVSAVSDAVRRDPANGRALLANPLFLDPAAALDMCVRPAVQGLGLKLGVLLFQLSPLPARWLQDPAALRARLEALWQAVLPALPSGSLAALEVRDAGLLTPALAASLKAHGVRFCLGLHDRMPALEDQLPMLRATWPGDLVCRWNLQRGLAYTEAKDLWAPFDRLQAPDPATRNSLARVMAATLGAGHRVFVTINNKAEGSAPLSVIALAQSLAALVPAGRA
jgi:uncharacterized protein YecE (DUF72 family)